MLLNIFLLTLLHHVASYDSEIFPEILREKEILPEVLKGKNVILRLSSRNCELCESNTKEWDMFADEHKNNKIHTEKIYCEDRKDLCQKLKIQHYPTIMYHFGQEWLPFLHKQTKKNFEHFLSKRPPICRFPDDISGCHPETIEWTQKINEHSTFDYEKEMENSIKSMTPIMQTLQEYSMKKRIIYEKKVFLDSTIVDPNL